MVYRDDFYRFRNIIGYTGNLHDFPTVYFQRGNEYGHITQKHDFPQNVGRMEVSESDGYSIGNELVNGTLKLVEKLNGKTFHESRSVLTVVNPFDAAQRHTVALLGQAIYSSNRGEKYISHWGDITTKSGKIIDLFDEYDTTAARKGAVNAQILATVPRRN